MNTWRVVVAVVAVVCLLFLVKRLKGGEALVCSVGILFFILGNDDRLDRCVDEDERGIEF